MADDKKLSALDPAETLSGASFYGYIGSESLRFPTSLFGSAAFTDAGAYGDATTQANHETRLNVLEGGVASDVVDRTSVSNPASPYTPPAINGNGRLDITGLDHNLTINPIPTTNQTNNVEATIAIRITASGADRTITFDSYTTILGTTPILVVPSGETREYLVQCVDGSTWSLLGDAMASETARGVVELATAAEINTGTDAARPMCPDQFAGSVFANRVITLYAFGPTQDCATGDGKVYYPVPAELNGYNIVGAQQDVITAGTTGTQDVQIARIRSGTPADVLSTKSTIDSTETSSTTAAAAAVINTSNDDLATGDYLRLDVDAVQTTPAKGLIMTVRCARP